MHPTPSSIYPCFSYRDAPAAIDWLCRAFGFERVLVVPGEGRAVAHAELSLGSDVIMLGSYQVGAGPGAPPPLGCEDHSTCVAVDDVDAHCARAVAAGAEIVRPLEDTDYGARVYAACDLEGHVWTFGTYRPELPKPRPASVTAYLCASPAADAIDFYRRAFGARELYRLPGPDATIGHAEVRIGGTTLYLSDEAPQLGVRSPQSLQGNSCSFVLDVDDVDAAWGRAIGAGARVERPIVDAPYGRGGWVVDPFGHRWSIMKSDPDFKPEGMA